MKDGATIEDILAKLKLKPEQLNAEERKTLEEWARVMEGKQIDVPGILNFCETQILALTRELTNYENSKEKDLYLKATIRSLKVIVDFISAPTRSKAWLAKYLKDTHKISS